MGKIKVFYEILVFRGVGVGARFSAKISEIIFVVVEFAFFD